MQKNRTNSLLKPCIKVSSIWLKDTNAKPEKVKLLGGGKMAKILLFLLVKIFPLYIPLLKA